jgi:TetR/AcrR family transcriptional regulator, regulator of cefoperazone and chloramphenicol sensitivity
VTKNRRSTGFGYSRGEDTRARVIASALRLFGQRGFEGASTRDIAVDAGVNAPALQYYFSSKEGLYLACVEHMVARLWSHVGDATRRVEELLAKRADNAALIAAYCSIQEGMADFMFSSQEPADWLLIVVREQAGLGPDAGFQLIYREITSKLLKVEADVVSRLLHIPAGADEARIRAMALNGQLLVFLFLRRSLLTSLDWDGYRGDGIDLIKRIVRENTEGLLKALATTRVRKRKPKR